MTAVCPGRNGAGCDATFREDGYSSLCPACCPRPWGNGPSPRVGSKPARAKEPATPAARAAVELLKAIPGDPTAAEVKRIAERVGIVGQSVEKLWLRWIVLPERDRLRKLANKERP